jgi:hypothetical protein
VDADYKQTTREQEQPYQQRGKLNDVHGTMVGDDEPRCQRAGEDQHEGGVPRMNKTNSVMIRLSRNRARSSLPAIRIENHEEEWV